MLGKKKELEIPVYLFMGFLEAGKTTFIQETLEEDYFNDGERTLLFACEEGMEEYDEELLKRTNTTVVYVEEQERFQYRIPDKQAFTVLSRPCYYRI